MARIYKEKATTQSGGLLELGGIPKVAETAVKQVTEKAVGLEKQAQITQKQVDDTYKQANKNLLSTSMRQVYQTHSRNPEKFNEESEKIYSEMSAEMPPEQQLNLRTEFELSVTPYVVSVQDNYNKYQARYSEETDRKGYADDLHTINTLDVQGATNPEVSMENWRKSGELASKAGKRDSNGNLLYPKGMTDLARERFENNYYFKEVGWLDANFKENPKEFDKRVATYNNQSAILSQTGDNAIDGAHLKKLIGYAKGLQDGSLKAGASEFTYGITAEIASANIQQGTTFEKDKKIVSGQIRNPAHNNVGWVMSMMDKVKKGRDSRLISNGNYTKYMAQLQESKNLLYQRSAKLKPKKKTGFFERIIDGKNVEERLNESADEIFGDLEGDKIAIRDFKEAVHSKTYMDLKNQGIDLGVYSEDNNKIANDLLIKNTVETMQSNGMDLMGFEPEDINTNKILDKIIRKNKIDSIRKDLKFEGYGL